MDTSEQREYLKEIVRGTYTQTIDCDVFTASAHAIRWLLESSERKVKLKNEWRDKWLYEQWQRKTAPEIKAESKKQSKHWKWFKTRDWIHSIKRAASRYAERNGLPPLILRKSGRKPKQKRLRIVVLSFFFSTLEVSENLNDSNRANLAVPCSLMCSFLVR